MAAVRLKILGCGSSAGVPTLVGWGQCDPTNPKNRRTRASALLEVNNYRFLIDASPDVYIQFRRENIQSIDAIILTHFHMDHTAGLVDLFFLSRLLERKIPLLADTKTITTLKKSLGFVFDYENQGFFPHVVAYGGQDVLGVMLEFFPLEHGDVQSVGVRCGNVAYTVDTSAPTKQAYKALAGVERLVVPGRSFSGSYAHMSIDRAVQWCKSLGVREGFLTNMGCGVDYDAVSQMVPAGVSLCFDGMVIEGVSAS